MRVSFKFKLKHIEIDAAQENNPDGITMMSLGGVDDIYLWLARPPVCSYFESFLGLLNIGSSFLLLPFLLVI